MSARNPIKFHFDFDKFLNLVLLLSQKVPSFDKLKAVKLLYFIDQYHLVRHGKTITGDDYYRLPMGPIPTFSYDILKNLNSDSIWALNDQELKKVRDELSLEMHASHQYPVFVARAKPDLGCFSQAELESIETIIERLGNQSPVSLMDRSHLDATSRETSEKSKIDFRLFFKDNPDALQEAYEAMELEQDDRDFIDDV